MIEVLRRSLSAGLSAGVAAVIVGACGHAPLPGEDEPPPADPVENVEAEELYNQALGLAGQGDLTRAEQYLAAALTRGYPEELVLPMLVRVCVAASRIRVAIGYTAPYLQDHPNEWQLRLVIASLHMALEEPVEAREHLEQVLLQQPDEPEANYLMALIMRDEMGDPDAAERFFSHYLDVAPEGEHNEEVTYALRNIRIPVAPTEYSGGEQRNASPPENPTANPGETADESEPRVDDPPDSTPDGNSATSATEVTP